MKKRFSYVVVLFAVISANSFSQTKSAAEEFTSLMSEFESLSGEYKQTLTDKEGMVLQSTVGVFQLKKPGLFLWHTQPPFEQKVIGNQTSLWIYDPDLEQVTIKPQNEATNSPAKILSGDLSYLKSNYEVKKDSSDKSTSSFSLRALDASKSEFVAIVFSFNNKLINSLAIEDKLGQVTRLSFSDLKANRKIDDSIFTFFPPEGTDIIKQK